MSGQLIQNFLFACRHQFSWPRRTETGEYYQLCVHCGVKYRYDWAKMRRVARMGDEVPATTPVTSVRKCGSSSAWRPRERRLTYRVPILVRIAGEERWIEGTTENISRSGLLLQCDQGVEVGNKLELVFDMPAALVGEEPARAVCQAEVVRVEPRAGKRKDAQMMIACSIEECELSGQMQSEAS